MKNKTIHAEAWLDTATQILCKKYSSIGYETPKIRVFYGFTTNGFSKNSKKIYRGECLPRSWSKDNENIIFITPNTTDEIDVLSTLGHEIAHAIDDCKSLHGKNFKNIMKAFGYLYDGGFEFPSLKLTFEFDSISKELGKFPSISFS